MIALGLKRETIGNYNTIVTILSVRPRIRREQSTTSHGQSQQGVQNKETDQ
jgi:hypothetical protein